MRRALIAFVLLFAACGNGAEPEAAGTPDPTDGAPAVQKCEDRIPPEPGAEAEGEGEPEVEVPEGAPPCELVVQDIAEGDGAEAEEGATITVHYTGVSWSTGEEFDSSWGADPVTFPLGDVIAGWQEGIPGMKEGGRRRLIIPPDMAYGDQGGPGIVPNETLVFVIDLIEVAE